MFNFHPDIFYTNMQYFHLQAFLEFQEEASATAMVCYFQTNPAQVRLKPVFVQFSNHKELKTDASHAAQVEAILAIHRAF